MGEYLEALNKLTASGKSYLIVAIEVLIILAAGYVFSRYLSSRFKRVFSKFKHVDETLLTFMTGVIHYSLLVVTLIICLGKLGVQTTSIITVLGTAGLAVGLALQGTLSNIASGIMILFLRPFKIGEYIEAGDAKGTVQLIGLFSTQLVDVNGLFIMTPNSNIWSKTIVNFSRNKSRRVVLSIGISYGDDISKAKELILQTLDANASVLKEPAPQVLSELLDESSVNLQVRFWVKRADYIPAKSEVLQVIKEKMDENEITIPFPQSEVTLRKN